MLVFNIGLTQFGPLIDYIFITRGFANRVDGWNHNLLDHHLFARRQALLEYYGIISWKGAGVWLPVALCEISGILRCQRF
jgi:hypothetical protein